LKKIYPKVHLETQKTTNSQGNNTEQKEQCWRYHNTQLQKYYRVIAIKTVWYCHKNRYEDQGNRIEDPDMNPSSYTHLILDKVTKNIQWRKDRDFNKCCWEKWLYACRKLTLDPCLSPGASINSKGIKDLNIKPKTLQLAHERVGNTLEVIGIGKYFLSKTPAAQQLRERMDKWDYMKLKSFCTTKEMVSKLKRPVGENVC
jgi:hypothetical protein